MPDALLAAGGAAQSVQAKCPWCQETLSGKEINAIMPPALVIIGDEAALASEGNVGGEWGNDSWSGDTSTPIRTAASAPAASLGSAASVAGGNVVSPAASVGAGAMSMAGLDLNDPGELEPVSESSATTVRDTDFAQLETVEEVDTVHLEEQPTEIEDVAVDSESAKSEADELDFIDEIEADVDDGDLGITSEAEDDELSEFMVNDPDESDTRGSKPAEIMMDVSARRRRKSSSPIKSVIGVALGGLLSLPIVGTILHFLGQDIPVISDILPAVGGSKTQLRASTPMPLDNFEPRIVDDEPVTGRPIGEELNDATDANEFVDPASVALSEITGDSVDPMPPNDLSPTNDFGGTPQDNPVDFTAVDNTDAATPAIEESAEEMMTLPDSVEPEMAEPEMPELAIPELPAMESIAGSDSSDVFSDSSAEVEPFETTEPESPAVDVEAEVASLNKALDEIAAMDANDPARDAVVQETYENLSRLAGTVPSESMSELQPVLGKLSKDMKLVIAFTKASPAWISQSREERGSDGALVVGKMSSDDSGVSIRLVNKQELPVTLPSDVATAPSGYQIGLGQLQGSGRDATLSLDLIQSIAP
ncbi:hypothetical protein [Aporhodopirellula aestuarii]|uniref:Serine repeat-containing antigen n=1 Tax=Aporhodopirellula aestuarii TaxID=2950107 RepID=A0ABT0TYQ0_9BACT|nr:hypothetical protein [Aporhodopirellula aestuarii]MCM2369383.1 hypothetical protein [Aporhodopirellula aestuarii]